MQHDIVIVGASVTGSAVATLASERGMSVALVDRRPRAELGAARRAIPVPVWALEESRLPVGEVIRVPARIHLVAGDARASVATPDCVMLEPGALVASLVDRAVANRAAIVERARVVGVAPNAEGVLLEDGTTIDAKFVIDASGADGACLLGEPAVEPADVASIAHEAFRISERRLADAYLEAAGIERGESIVFLAPCGPGSLVVARVDEDARVLHFDAVTFGPDGDDHPRPTARAAIRRVARGYSWIAEQVAEDARHVALAGLRGNLAAGNVALVGGAAGVTRPTYGAECTLGLASARILVDTLANDGDLSRYERRVRARFDAVAEMDASLVHWFRMLDEGALAEMIRSGAIGQALVSAILEQRAARIPAMRFVASAAVRRGRAVIAHAFDADTLSGALRMTPLRAGLWFGGRG